jgi:3-hydroxyisobutyrate dehydrogenase
MSAPAPADRMTVGFAGLGTMGWPMARNLVHAGYQVVVHDAADGLAERFAGEFGGVAAASPSDFAPVGVLVTMLPDGKITQQVLLEWEGGIAQALAPGSVVVDMGSSNPVDTLALATALRGRGVAVVDAPVSGGKRGADAGTLSIMIGTDSEDAFARAEPVLEALGSRLIRTGRLGSGHAMKALNNFCAGAAYATLAEALVIGKQFGLSGDTMIEVISVSSGRSFNSDVVFKDDVVSGRYGSGFALALLAKDVGIAASLAESSGVSAPVCALVSERLAGARDDLPSGADHSEAHKAWWDDQLASPS